MKISSGLLVFSVSISLSACAFSPTLGIFPDNSSVTTTPSAKPSPNVSTTPVSSPSPTPDCSDIGSSDNVGLSQSCDQTDLAPTSTFDSDDEGWLLTRDAQEGTDKPDYHPTGGNPGGYLSPNNNVAGSNWYWSAPDKFLGNQESPYQRTLLFDLKPSTLSSQFENGDLILEGNGKRLAISLNQRPGLDWNHYAVELDTRAPWRIKDSQGELASPEDIRDMLRDLERLWIRGEYVAGKDAGSLDNVILGH